MNNMNFIGMNPMGMNNNIMPGMNNMGMMGMVGMNNQMNLMNMKPPNIQNIIQSYENRIRELEELIRQKDLEIFTLNQKLNNNPNNLMPNINDIRKLYPNKDYISINIKAIIKCLKKDKPSVIFDLLKSGIISLEHKPISLNKTLEENGIKECSTINISEFIYSIRFSIDPSKNWIINLDGECSIKQAIKYFLEKIKSESFSQNALNGQIYFIFNNTKLNIQDETAIKDYFLTTNDPNILIIGYTGGLMGG